MQTTPYLRTPAVSPDGSAIAFVYAADIWLVGAEGGLAERINAHPAGHWTPRFSPDGSTIAFAANRAGVGDVYLLPLGGGEVSRLSFHERPFNVEDWAADGQWIYASANRDGLGYALYAIPLVGGTPVTLIAEPFEDLTHAVASPDGGWLAFNNVRSAWWRHGPTPFAPSEIWLTAARPASEAPLPRLIVGSDYRGLNRWPLWSPDGTGLYFVSDRDGTENIWYQPLEGGAPLQITRFQGGRLLWPAIARQSGMIVFEHEWQLWHLDPQSREVAPIPIMVRADSRLTPVRTEYWNRGFSEMQLAPDGKKVAFIARGKIFADFADKETDKEQRQGASFPITGAGGRERHLTWSPDSRSLIYVSDRNGEDELYRYDFLTRRESRLTSDLAPRALPCCSPDGAWAALLRGTDTIELIDLRSGEVRPFARGNFVWCAALAWSPDSRWLAYISHDSRSFANVYVQSLDEQEPHQITFLSNIGGGDLLWAPNGRFLVFTTGQYRSESQVVRIDLRPPEPLFREAEFEKLFEEPRKPGSGERGAGTEDGGQEPADKAAEPEQREPEKDERAQGEAPPEQDQNTKSRIQSLKPKTHPPDLSIVFEGIERRLHPLTPIQMDARAQTISPDSRDLLFLASVADKVNIWSLPLDEPRRDQPPRQLTASGSAKSELQFTPDGKAFFYLEDGQIIVRKFPNGNDPLTLAVRGEVTVDFHQEKRQIFLEAWRALRDSFYDPTFRGQDWQAVREHFLPLINEVRTTGDLHTLINLMAGELRASHLGLGGGNGGGNNDGYTGLIFDPAEQFEHGFLRIANIVLDSPAALADNPPRPGEYLVAIDDTPLVPGVSLDRLLQRTAGRRLRLQLAPAPAAEERREVVVRPLDAADFAELRYRAWVVANERYVHRVSGGRLGYVHVAEMSYHAYQQFLADLDAETHSKDGVVLDVRYNGGGHTATFLLDVLMRRSLLVSGFRDRGRTDAGHLSGNRVLNKPTILVTNERSSSNTEMFAESYRRLGLGTIVGRPTAGAVIWTGGMRLLDGAHLRLPRFFVATPEGEDLEGHGRPVDIDVERPLGEWDRGRDRQLDAAVAALLEQIV